MKSSKKDYDNLHALSRKNHLIGGAAGILHWDQETYMPNGAAASRAEQTQVLAGLIHEGRTNKKFANALSKLINLKTGKVIAKGLDHPQAAAVKVWHRDFIKETCLPKKFVEDFAKLSSQSIEVWKEAKKNNSFQHFAPYLDKIVAMNKRKADLLGYQEHPYDALLDNYEPDITTAEVTEEFARLRKSITALLKKIKSAKQVDDSFLFGKFSPEKQMELAHEMLKQIGYDFNHGRLDLSAHPFSSASHPSDSRITTRIHATSLMSSVSSVLHEMGHALYEMGLPHQHFGSPLCEAISLGVHESQSRWWETRIGQSKPFWNYFLPRLQKTFKGKLDKVSLDEFYRAINKVEPSLIRVEADEVTYPLHVIVRFELEKALIEGKLAIRELPEAWNAKMQDMLGIEPKTVSEGCLQDIHWSMGAFGYFPTYALGNLYASHLFLGFEKKHPNWQERVAKGEFDFIIHWLHEHVYQYGRRYNSKELLKLATGKDFSADAYTKYLNKKYSEIYKLKS